MADEATQAWAHFVKVLRLKEGHQRALQGQGVNGIHDILVETKKDNFFTFDDNNDPQLFPSAIRRKLVHAGEWLGYHQCEIGDLDWFKKNFTKSFLWQVDRRKKRDADAARMQEENKRFKKTKRNQQNASFFTADENATLQGMPTLPNVYYEHLVPSQVKEWFTNKVGQISDENAMVQTMALAFVEHGSGPCLKAVPETYETEAVPRAVQRQHLDFIAETLDGPMSTERVFRDGLPLASRRTLENLGVTHGVSLQYSFPDGYFHTKEFMDGPVQFITTAILDCKGTGASPLVGHAECLANATSAAMAMYKLGIPAKDIVVPLVSTTGSEAQVGAVYMLEPSQPAVCYVTKTLRLAQEDDERIEFAKLLVAMGIHAEEVQKYVTSTTLTPIPEKYVVMRYDTELYHTKNVKDFFLCCGQDMVESSFLRYLHRTSRLGKEDYACLPIAFRLKDDESIQYDEILFDKLVGYEMGLPADKADRQALVSKIEEVVHDMHGKGVIHMDLFLSNIMWKKEEGGLFSVRLIDFDAVHLLGEHLTDAALVRLREENVGLIELGGIATEEHDTLFVDLLKANIDNEALRVKRPGERDEDVKRRLDAACTALMQPILDKRFP